MNTEPMNFDDILPVAVDVSIGSKPYILREASGEAARAYRNAVLRAARPSKDGSRLTLGEGMPEAETLLVSLCLFEITDKGERPVRKQTILEWPNRVQNDLFDRAKQISKGLVNEETEESLLKEIADAQEKLSNLRTEKEKTDALKNSYAGTTAGSD